jgi:GNAT superfamily N-acetyltransferase
LGGVEIVTVEGKGAMKSFIEFQYTLYKDDPHFVPQPRVAVKDLLHREKHPFYKNAEMELFLAHKDGKIVGRIAAIFDRAHNRYHEEKAGFFGFFECIDDREIARALLERARQWTKSRGATFLRGPVNPSTNYECGTLVEGFDSSPMVMMTYNPRYYPTLFENAGMRKAKDLLAYSSHAQKIELSKIERVAERALKQNGVTVRQIDMKDFAGEVGRVWSVYSSAWSKNWGYVPMSKEEFERMAKEMKMILKPELALIGEKEGRTVGFALALPDVNQALKPAGGHLFPLGILKILYYQRLVKSVRVIALGVVEEFRTTGLAAAFYAILVRNARQLGFGETEMSWILEDNTLMNRSIQLMGAERYKTYRLYEWN